MPRLNLSSFLFESPIKVWKAKQTDLSQEQLLKAEEYFKALTGPLKDYFRKDLTSLGFDQIELLYLSIKEAKNFGIGVAKGGSWLTNQILLNPSLIFQDIKDHYIPVLVSYNRNLKNPEIKNLNLDEIPDIQELDRILNSIESEICFTALEAEVGKVIEKGGWEVFLPTTTEASIVLGKRGCGKRDNTWCTTQEEGRNLFLNYGLVDKVTLFYVIKKNTCADRGNPEHKMSVGFVDGQPRFNMGDGRITVDAANKNLTFERFQQVLGEELADEFLEAMKQKAGSLGGEPAALKEAEMLVASPKRFIKKFEGYPDDENGDDARKQIADFALKSYKTDKDVLSFLAKSKLSNLYNIRIGIAKHPDAPEDVLEILARDENSDVRAEVAQHPNTSEDILEILARDKDPNVREAIARNPNVSQRFLLISAKSSHRLIRAAVAQNPNAPEDVLRILARDKNPDIRFYVAQHPNAPEDVLRILAGDGNLNVRLFVAQNPNLPEDALRILAGDESSHVRESIAYRENTPEDVLEILARDKDPDVRAAVAKNPNTPEGVLINILLNKQETRYVKNNVALNTNLSAKYLNILADHKDIYTRMYVAQNPNTPRGTLIKLANDPENYVSIEAIENARRRNIPLQESKYRRNKLKLLSILF